MGIVAKKIMMGSGAVGDPVDDQFNRVSFLSHFDGSNDGVNNAFDDSSTSNHTITANGAVTQGSFGPFARPDGEWGVSFDEDGDYLSSANSSDWALADGEWTIEAWIFVRSVGSSNKSVIGHWTNSSRGWQARLAPSGSGYNIKWTWTTNGSSDSSYTGSIVADFNKWNHVAWVRASDTITLYVNGVAGGTGSGANIYTPSTPLVIGYWDSNDADFNGVISNLRLVKGTAVYTSNFTPSTSKLTAITNTKLLTCQSNRFVDNSASGHTITPTGNTAVTAFGPFLTSAVYDAAVNGASLGSDGSGDYLTIPQTTDMDLSGNFTVECWVYLNQVNKTQGFIGKWGGTNKYGWIFYVRNNGEFAFFSGNNGSLGTQLLSGVTATKGQWYHIAVSRTSSTVSYFVNGVRTATGSDSNNNTTGDTLTWIASDGSNTSSNSVNGYLSDARVIKGTALYDGTTYTIPTAPLTAVTNTKLLLNMADGQAIDSAAQNNLTLYGNAKISTGQAKFGNTSLLFDGSGDYALASDTTSFELGSGDWTIETFVWAVGVSNTPYILDARSSSSANEVVPTIYVNSSRLEFWVSNSARIQAGEDLSLDAWNHVALCKSGSSTKMFINGTQSGSTYTDNNTYIKSTYVYIGMRSGTTSQSWNGYMDEFRISKMARYTSNFTAPSEPFADKGQ